MVKIRFLLIVLVVLGAGGALWWVQNTPNLPQPSFAQLSVNVPTNWRAAASLADRTIAQGIRGVAQNGIHFDQIVPIEDFRKLGQATVSAEVSLTPEELWQTFREQGSQAVLTTVGNKVEYEVNGVSATAVNEARYQYCKGVVDAYESSR